MRRMAFLSLTCAGVFWGLGFPLAKMVLGEIDAPHMVLLRLTVAALAALPFALRPGARKLFRSPSNRAVIAISAGCTPTIRAARVTVIRARPSNCSRKAMP